jgi:pimeloyl-ACP methyl ester carboxylesterase
VSGRRRQATGGSRAGTFRDAGLDDGVHRCPSSAPPGKARRSEEPITLDGGSDGITPSTDGASYAAKFSGRHTHRVVPGVGHNLPQEAPQAFADAVVEVDGY